MDLDMGAMSSLLGKLVEAIKDEYNLQKEVKEKLESFSADLKAMQAALGKVAEVPRDQLEDETKVWADQVRELSYEMEDVIDSFLVLVEGCDPNPNDDQNRLKKLWVSFKELFKKDKEKHRISTDVVDIDKQLQKLAIRRERYQNPNLPAATRATLDPCWEVLYGDKKNIIGLEEARNNIIKKITEGDCKQLKILSIVGFGGLDKTTLAKDVYDALAPKFELKAFVSVSRNPDMKKVLSILLFKLDKTIHATHNASSLEVEQLIILIKELLSNKSNVAHLQFGSHSRRRESLSPPFRSRNPPAATIEPSSTGPPPWCRSCHQGSGPPLPHRPLRRTESAEPPLPHRPPQRLPPSSSR